MREKFRAWVATAEVMLTDVSSIDFSENTISFYDKKSGARFSVHPDFVMKYTGRNDVEGNEVFESDIVQFTYWWFDGNIAESTLTGTIIYSDACMSFQLKGVKNKEWQKHTGHENDYLTPFSELDFEDADFLVIGNIYQDSHLLNETN